MFCSETLQVQEHETRSKHRTYSFVLALSEGSRGGGGGGAKVHKFSKTYNLTQLL